MASAILFATVSRQVWKQWKEGQREGVSHWLFIGQMAASAGFLAYSWMLDNWIFVVSNAFLLLAAVIGQIGMMRTSGRHGNPSRAASSGPRDR
jgi:hypothetical protein